MNTHTNELIVDDESASRSLLGELLRINFPTIQLVGTAAGIIGVIVAMWSICFL